MAHVLRVKLRSNGVERAARRVRAAAAPWVLIDESALDLDLDKAFVLFPGKGRRRPALIGALRQLGAARQIVVTRSRRDIVCVLLFRRDRRDAVFAALEALDDPFAWDDVIDEDRAIERETWYELSRQFARDEGLAETDDGS